MFDKQIYIHRRKLLKQIIGKGIILLPGNNELAYNYPSNTYPFRQDSNFLYFFGIDRPGLIGFIDIDNDTEYIAGNDYSSENIIWQGVQESIKSLALRSGITNTIPANDLESIRKNIIGKRKVHFLPCYRYDTNDLFNAFHLTKKKPSEAFIKAVVSLRSIKSSHEIDSIREMNHMYANMLKELMKHIRPGVSEQHIAGYLEGMLKAKGCVLPFETICSVRGEILHNPYYNHTLKKGQLLLIDGGCESKMHHYCSDITRVFPVSGHFSRKQKDIYQIVLQANVEAINKIKAGMFFRDVHLHAARIITAGLKDLKIIKGSVDEAVYNGVHTLFFPHGLGHLLGLDVHDMEGLGEDYVGYDANTKRTNEYGLSRLRFARELKAGYVLTIEPGIYFIPELIKKWRKEKLHNSFIDYNKLEQYLDFGGIRIEDNILVKEKNSINLSIDIPKELVQIEDSMQTFTS